jgi:arginase
MDLALALGHGPAVLSNLDDMRPLVRDADVAVLGYRGDLSGYGALTSLEGPLSLLWLPLTEVRSRGASNAARAALSRFASPSCEGFWIHLDVDVLDDHVMPAVDSRQPDGMSWAELGDVLLELLASASAVGMQVTILDPELDPDGSVVERFVAFMESLFAHLSPTRFRSA